MEEEASDALEMAEKADEEREKTQTPEEVSQYIY